MYTNMHILNELNNIYHILVIKYAINYVGLSTGRNLHFLEKTSKKKDVLLYDMKLLSFSTCTEVLSGNLVVAHSVINF